VKELEPVCAVRAETPLDDPSAINTSAFRINNAGQIAGGYNNNRTGTDHGFLLSGGTYTTINDPQGGQGSTDAFGLNNAGQIVGDFLEFGIEGFLYGGGAYTTLDDPLSVNAPLYDKARRFCCACPMVSPPLRLLLP
jgi:hypothetical protein